MTAGRGVAQHDSPADQLGAPVGPEQDAEAGRVHDLDAGQVDDQVTHAEVQRLVQDLSHLGRGTHVQPTAQRDLVLAGYLDDHLVTPSEGQTREGGARLPARSRYADRRAWSWQNLGATL